MQSHLPEVIVRMLEGCTRWLKCWEYSPKTVDGWYCESHEGGHAPHSKYGHSHHPHNLSLTRLRQIIFHQRSIYRHLREFLSSFVKLNQSVLVKAHFYIIDQSLIDWLMFRFYYSTNLKGFSLLPDLCHLKVFSDLINWINLHFVWR